MNIDVLRTTEQENSMAESLGRYLEDFEAGQTFRSGQIPVDVESIKRFATEFDPQAFHLDEQAASESIFGGLAASGWHTAAITMRMLVDSDFAPAGGIVGAGFDELRWPRPVRPGDKLRVESEVLEVRDSKSRPGQGVIKVRNTTLNQNDEPVQVSVGNLIVRRSGTVVALPARRDVIAQSATVSQTNLHDSAPTQFQEVGDVRLAYRRFGKEGAPPLVCLQHFTGRMDNWDPIHTNRLAQDRPVVLVDYRGVGRSTGETPSSMQGMARDIIAFIRNLGAGQADVFGFSIGGMVAQQVALDAPELVRRLILVGTGPSGGEGMAAFSPQVQEIFNRPNITPAERFLELFFSPTATSQAAGKAWLSRITERQVDREPDATPQVAAAQLAALAKWGQVTGKRYGDLKKIKQRTLVVNGHDDIMVPTVNSFILQQQLPDARLMLFPDSGHGAHFQFGEEFADAAARFLAAN